MLELLVILHKLNHKLFINGVMIRVHVIDYIWLG